MSDRSSERVAEREAARADYEAGRADAAMSARGDRDGGGAGLLGFLLGLLLLVVVAVAAIYLLGGDNLPTPEAADVNIDVEAPSLPDAPSIPSPGGS